MASFCKGFFILLALATAAAGQDFGTVTSKILSGIPVNTLTKAATALKGLPIKASTSRLAIESRAGCSENCIIEQLPR